MRLATLNSRTLAWVAGCLGVLAGAGHTLAETSEPGAQFVAFATRTYQEAQARYRAEPTNASAAWEFGRACFDLAEFATNRTERASLAEQGIAACREAIASQSNSAPAHYYLGMNLGQLARTRGLSALRLVDQMEQEFLRTRALDERFDYAGPDRCLGLLYRDAPVIASVGSRSKARRHLRRAVELAPQYPGNGLELIEAYLAWGDRNDAYRQLKLLEAAWPAARTNLAGEAWAASWANWEPQLRKLQQKLPEPAKPLVAPRAKQ